MRSQLCVCVCVCVCIYIYSIKQNKTQDLIKYTLLSVKILYSNKTADVLVVDGTQNLSKGCVQN